MNVQASITEIMSTDLKTAHPEDPVQKLDDIFREHRIHHVPITDAEGRVVGIISKSDFLFLLRGFTVGETDRFRESAKLRAFKVAEIMAKEVETINVSTTIKQAVDILAENRFNCLPVVDDENVLKGVVTTHDIVTMVQKLG